MALHVPVACVETRTRHARTKTHAMERDHGVRVATSTRRQDRRAHHSPASWWRYRGSTCSPEKIDRTTNMQTAFLSSTATGCTVHATVVCTEFARFKPRERTAYAV
eukprot:scaffold2911_cov414-Prasinococcus_capsulatus_cf.AAC.54